MDSRIQEPEDSSTINRGTNGTRLLMFRARPIVATVAVCATIFVPTGMLLQKVNSQDSVIRELERDVGELRVTLERDLGFLRGKSVDNAALQTELDTTKAYASRTFEQLALLKAELISEGVIGK